MHNAAVVIVKVAPCTLMLQFSVVAYCMYENIKSGGDFPQIWKLPLGQQTKAVKGVFALNRHFCVLLEL